jgi:hypothetical protein
MSDVPSSPPEPALSAVETFLRALESRTKDPTHLRLLKTARHASPVSALEKELATVMEEILHEA